MKKVIIKNSEGQLTHTAMMEDPTEWIETGIANNWWGLSEREELDEMRQPTGTILPATFSIEVIDLNLDPQWLLEEVRRKRKKEYPAVEDYMDGLVKGDQAQMDKYIADCLAVKNKYPKPE